MTSPHPACFHSTMLCPAWSALDYQAHQRLLLLVWLSPERRPSGMLQWSGPVQLGDSLLWDSLRPYFFTLCWLASTQRLALKKLHGVAGCVKQMDTTAVTAAACGLAAWPERSEQQLSALLCLCSLSCSGLQHTGEHLCCRSGLTQQLSS